MSRFTAEGLSCSGERAKVRADLSEANDPLLEHDPVIGKPAHQVYTLILHEGARLDQQPTDEVADFDF